MCDPDAYPTDDHDRTMGEIKVLNRIDQEWLCTKYLGIFDDCQPDYCSLPEHDPFTNRCWDHTPGNLTSGHM